MTQQKKELISNVRQVLAIGLVLLGRMAVLVTWLYFVALYEPQVLNFAVTFIPGQYWFSVIPSVMIVFGTIFILFIFLQSNFWSKLFIIIRGRET